jgi:PIN domain nuclease of toxin-antitoxin system
VIAEGGFLAMPINVRHAWEAGRLPRHHGDPFDRMLAAQAIAERLVCVTRDPAFAACGVPVLW